MQVQLLREWAGPRDPFGNYTLYPQGHVGNVEDDVGAYLVGVGFANVVGVATPEQQAAVDIMRQIADELRKVAVEPTIDAVAQTLANMMALEQQQAAQNVPPAPTVDAATATPPASASTPDDVLTYDPPRAEIEPEVPVAPKVRRKAAG